MDIKISLTNSKLGAQIPSINLPALKTCRADAPCRKGCYACRGNFLYKNVANSHASNLAFFIKDSKKYFNAIVDYLNGFTVYRFFRWHAAGDIVSDEYFAGMVNVARKCKNTCFLCFTKKFEIVNNFIKAGHRIPKNLKIKFSAWDKDFKVINPYGFGVAYVDFKDKSKNPDIPPDAIPCCGSCEKCGVGCWRYDGDVVFKQH